MADHDLCFQESATATLCTPILYPWGPRFLYLGAALGLSPHRNAVAVLALSLDKPFEVADPAGNYRRCRSALVPPNTLHHLRGTTGRMAFLYVDPSSRDFARLRASYSPALEHRLLIILNRLASGASNWQTARAALRLLLTDPQATDSRVHTALAGLHADPSARIPLGDLAATAGLSTSRFRHLFREETGLTLRRYRLWIAMGAATRAIASGGTLTDAALGAGFASSAHFSAAFREMFGMEPSRLIQPRQRIRFATNP